MASSTGQAQRGSLEPILVEVLTHAASDRARVTGDITQRCQHVRNSAGLTVATARAWDLELVGHCSYVGGIGDRELVWTVIDRHLYDVAIILRSIWRVLSRQGRGYTSWTLFWVDAATTTTPLGATLGLTTCGGLAAALDNFRVTDLGGAWASDYGIATTAQGDICR